MHVHAHMPVHMRVCACACACSCVCMCMCMHACVPVCVRVIVRKRASSWTATTVGSYERIVLKALYCYNSITPINHTSKQNWGQC